MKILAQQVCYSPANKKDDVMKKLKKKNDFGQIAQFKWKQEILQNQHNLEKQQEINERETRDFFLGFMIFKLTRRMWM